MCNYLYFIGLTLTLHLTRINSLVLLTAKFEDLKKIAKNFFDDAIFQQLAEFIYKLNENKVVDIFDDDLKEKQTKRGSELVKDKSESDVSLSSENMKYKPSNLKNNVKTRFESKSRHIKPNDIMERENKNIKKTVNYKYFNDGLTIDNIESDDSNINTEKTKKTKTKGRTISDRTFRISTVTNAKERNEFDQYDNFKHKNQWRDFLRSRYIQT